MALRRIRIEVDHIIDDEKQSMVSRDWKAHLICAQDAVRYGSGPEDGMIIESSEVVGIHVHDSTDRHNCEGCIINSQDEKN